MWRFPSAKQSHAFEMRYRRCHVELLESRDLLAFDIVINAGPTLAANQPALDAFEAAAELWEAHISDPITVTIDADLEDLGDPNVIGQASSVQLVGGYDLIRDQLVLDAADETDDGIVAALPTAGQASFFLPGGNFSLSGDVLGTKAALKAAGFTGLDAQFGTTDATITFNTQFSFDYDNSDGVSAGTMDFLTVAAHEIGHALGFVSEVDTVDYYLGSPIPTSISPSLLDLFRFENDTVNDPSNTSEFTTFTRNLVPGVESVTDQITAKDGAADENGMSTGYFTGDGRQASHWKDNNLSGLTIGVLDPTLALGQVIGISDADLRALDLIGYEIQFSDDVDPGNTAPVAQDDAAQIQKKSGVATGNVLDNDTDADGDPLTAELVDGPSNGSVQLNSDGSYTYTPGASFSGSDTFTYVASDGTDTSNVATVTITSKGGGGGGGGGKNGGGGGPGGGKGKKAQTVVAGFSQAALAAARDALRLNSTPSGLVGNLSTAETAAGVSQSPGEPLSVASRGVWMAAEHMPADGEFPQADTDGEPLLTREMLLADDARLVHSVDHLMAAFAHSSAEWLEDASLTEDSVSAPRELTVDALLALLADELDAAATLLR